MSLQVSFNSDAWDDLQEIEEYLSNRFSERNAGKYVRRILAACHRIGLAPYRGKKREDIGPNVRSVGFEDRITIIFEIEPHDVVILALHYGGRTRR